MQKFTTWMENANVSYTAVVLSPMSRIALMNHLKEQIDALTLKGFTLQTVTGSPLIHHMTINLGSLDETLNDKSILGQNVPLKVVSYAEDDKVAAVGIETNLKTINAQPHVTIAISKNGKPFMSNNLTNWQPIEPITINGIVQEL